MEFSEIKSTQVELNGHVSMLIKTFKIGEGWDHVERMRETMINNSQAVCPLYLLFKDHKGWDQSKGPVPPTRPVASGNRGMNLHLSEILSEILEPVADRVENSCEVISTEDIVARMLVKDKSLVGWHERSWMRNVVREGFSACMECRGSEDYEFDKNNPELCKCGTSPLEVNIGTKDVVNMDEVNDCMKNLRVEEVGVKDLIQPKVKNLCDGMKKMVVADDGMKDLGIKDSVNGTNGVWTKELVNHTGQGEYTGQIKTSMNFMELLRQDTWSNITSNLGEGEMLDSREVQTEMIQDYGAPMEIIGFDVDALYPSLD